MEAPGGVGADDNANDVRSIHNLGCRAVFLAMSVLAVSGNYPIGATALYVVAYHRSPLVMIVQMTSGGWKVDPRWWIGMVELSTTEPEQGTPSYAVRRLIAAMIAGDRNKARTIATPNANMDLLFDGAPDSASRQAYSMPRPRQCRSLK